MLKLLSRQSNRKVALEALESRRLLAGDFVGQPDSYVLAADEPSYIDDRRGVLANDVKVDIASQSTALVRDVTHGVIDLRADGSFVYSPPVGFVGTDVFTYKLVGADAESDEITVDLNVIANPIVVTEFMASNVGSYLDENGDSSDWVELSNLSSTPMSLAGWHLTDNPTELDKWQFPDVVVPAHGFLIVFASGKNRVIPESELHTNFRLSVAGEYLGLTRPDLIVADEYVFPQQYRGISYGRAMSFQTTHLLDGAESFSYIVPTSAEAELGDSWTATGFDDSAWNQVSNPQAAWAIGYSRGSAQQLLGPLIATDVMNEMRRVNSSLWIRQTFPHPDFPSISGLTLRIRHDDGFVAYVNGRQIAEAKAPSSLKWNSTATGIRSNEEVVSDVFEFHITDGESLIGSANVLAIHGLNSSKNSADLLIDPQLIATSRATLVKDLPVGHFQFGEATPGAANPEVTFNAPASTPDFSIDRGFHDQPFDLVIRTNTPGVALVVTTDGSEPTLQNGMVVTPSAEDTTASSTIRVDKTSTVRAAAVNEGQLPSEVATYTYIFLDDIVTQDFEATLANGLPPSWNTTAPDYGMDPDVIGPNDLFGGTYRDQIIDSLTAVPSLSLVLDVDDMFGSDGIYSNPQQTGSVWERATSVELIHPDGQAGFQSDAGIRIQGGAFRRHDLTKKKSFRLAFRQQYGASKLSFPFFGDEAADEFDNLVLRANNNDGWQWGEAGTRPQYLRDEWFHATQRAMGHLSPHGNFVHLYINGVYWGLYNPVERPDAAFSASYLGADREDWDALNHGTPQGGLSWGLIDGNDDAWKQLNSLARDVDTPDQTISNAAYQRLLGNRPDGSNDPNLETLLDVENFIDYMILNLYGGNWDWSRNNWYAGRLRGSSSTGFQYYSWDAEYTMGMGADRLGHSDLRINKTGESEDVANVYDKLRANDEFLLLFADHVHQHFFNGGTLYVDPNRRAWDVTHPERNVPAARYAELAELVRSPLIAESARWGDQHRARPYTIKDWETTRNWMFSTYFPLRSEIVLQQLRNAGLYPTLEAPKFHQHGGAIASGFELSIAAVGDVYYTLDGSDPRRNAFESGALGPGISPVAVKYDGPIAISESTVVKARTFVDGEWSALTEASFRASVPAGRHNLRISEVHYHPANPTADELASGFDDADRFEFIELVNIGQISIDLSHVRFTKSEDAGGADGIDFRFSNGGVVELPAGGRAVVVEDAEAFRFRYGEHIPIAGQWSGGLSNMTDTITLVSEDQMLQQFTYHDDWHPTTDGDGPSLEIIHASDTNLANWSQAPSWRPSWVSGGTPGFAGERVLGDANHDGIFDSKDLVVVFIAGKYNDDVDGNATFEEGDWNQDGDFDDQDIVAAFIAGHYIADGKAAARDFAAAIDLVLSRTGDKS